MSENFRSPLESVPRDDKLRWLDDPVTVALIATLQGFAEANARQIVDTVRSNSLNEDTCALVRWLTVNINVCEKLVDHIKFVRNQNVVA